jgi:hypothetical protein
LNQLGNPWKDQKIEFALADGMCEEVFGVGDIEGGTVDQDTTEVATGVGFSPIVTYGQGSDEEGMTADEEDMVAEVTGAAAPATAAAMPESADAAAMAAPEAEVASTATSKGAISKKLRASSAPAEEPSHRNSAIERELSPSSIPSSILLG